MSCAGHVVLLENDPLQNDVYFVKQLVTCLLVMCKTHMSHLTQRCNERLAGSMQLSADPLIQDKELYQLINSSKCRNYTNKHCDLFMFSGWAEKSILRLGLPLARLCLLSRY